MPSTRIKNIVKELNIGLSTVTDFLKKKGHEVDSNPNAKISCEQAQLCVNEFGKELSESERSALMEKLTAPKSPKASSKVTAPKVDEKSEKGAEKTTSEASSATATEPVKASVGPKVIGKVELDSKNRPVSKPKASVKAEDKEASKTTAPAIEKPEVVKSIEEKPAEVTPLVSDVVNTPKEEDRGTTPAVKEQVTGTPESPKSTNPDKVQSVTDDPKTTATAKKVAPKSPKAEVKKEATRSKTPKKEHKEVKAKAVKKEMTPEVDPKQQTLSDIANIPAREHTEPEMMRGETPKVGLTVVGKIDLPVESSSRGGKDKRGKRKRINKKKVDIEKDAAATTSNDRQGANKERRSGGNKRSKSKPEQGRKAKRQQQLQSKPEVTQEDIQKQIKETLAQMQNKRSGAQAAKYRKDKREAHRREQDEIDKKISEDRTLRLTEYVTANDLAQMIEVPVTDIITMCFNLGIMVSINQRLEKETIDLILDEYGYEPEYVEAQVLDAIQEEEDKAEDLKPRAPIVTVMGHVDHGKTKLLDCIRNSDVASGEAGGITQHVGAYSVTLADGRKITFLDTPGHEAFTAMRARGAKVTDIVIVVVAADDGVMPQTKEAINHAAIAGVPIIFAINKIDKPHANPDKIKEELSNLNYLVEDWGGKYQSQNISAKNNIGITDLLEKVLLEAELLDLKANPNKRAIGSVLESTMEVGRGYTTKVLIQEGTLHVGDYILAGTYHGRVKALFNERGKNVESVGPAEPVKVLGLNGAAQAGEAFNVLETEQEAREIANKRTQLKREQKERTQRVPTLQNLGQRIAEGNIKELNVIVKGDVDGSVEALSDSIVKLSTDEIRVNVIHKAVGQISDSDVVLAAASDAVIIGFQVRPAVTARRLAESEGVEIRTYSIIYTALDDVKSAMEGMLSPEIKENITANLEVRETFKITKVGTIAGCMVKDGKVSRTDKVRVIRDGIVIFTGVLGSLKRFKDDVKEVTHGYECGLNIDGFNDIAVGDNIEAYEEIEVKKKL